MAGILVIEDDAETARRLAPLGLRVALPTLA
jgi:hypothetical protein